MSMYNSERKSAIVVEDEPLISRVCRRVLMAEGFDVDLAADGLIAKELIKTKFYDLCLSDIRTPEMNGVELYRYLEKEYPGLASKVIFTTGDVLSGNIGAFLKEVQRPFLAKPFTPDELKKVVQESLNQASTGILCL